MIRISYSLHRSVCSLTRPTSTNGASGRCWVRTSVLLVSSTSPITFCNGVSGNSAVLLHFCLRERSLCPLHTEPRPGCSTSIRGTLGLLMYSLRVLIHAWQRATQACRLRLDKLVSFLCLALSYTVLRSRWCQSGVNRVRISCLGVVWLRRVYFHVRKGHGAKWQLLYEEGGD